MKKIKSEHAKSEQDLLRLDSKRREFIKKSTLMGAGIVASTVIPGIAIANVDEEKVDINQQNNKGYQLTQHIVDYYKSAAS